MSGNVLITTMDAPDRVIAIRFLSRCSADVAPDGGNGAVDRADLLYVLTNWLTVGCTPANVNRLNDVDFSDLLFVILNWGACP